MGERQMTDLTKERIAEDVERALAKIRSQQKKNRSEPESFLPNAKPALTNPFKSPPKEKDPRMAQLPRGDRDDLD